MYVKISGNTVVQYPADPRTDNPNVSLPIDWVGGTIGNTEYATVAETTYPTANVVYENVIENDPVLTDEVWERSYSVVNASPSEVTERLNSFILAANATAHQKLLEIEPYISRAYLDNVQLHNDLLTYKTQLDDHTTLTGYPIDPQWPSMPNNFYSTTQQYVRSWTVIANTTISNTDIPVPAEYSTAANLISSAEEILVVAKQGNEYYSTTIYGKAVQSFPVTIVVQKNGSTIATFFANGTANTVVTTLNNSEQLTVLLR